MTVLILALFTLAQQPAAAVSNRATVTGVIVNGVTKQPLRKAEVRLVPTGPGVGQAQAGGPGGGPGGGFSRAAVVATGDDGRFEFKDVEPGTYAVSARRNGFVELSGNGPRVNQGTRLEVSGKDLSGIQVDLTPQAVIAGRVVDEDGEPLQGILVQAIGSQPYRNQRRLLPMNGVQTDDRGEFRILNLHPGAYLLQFTPSRWGGGLAGAAGDDPGLGYAPMYYPGVNEARQAEKVRVAAGAELSGFQLRLTRSRVVRIRGRIFDTEGQALRQFSIQLLPRDSPVMGFVPPQMNRLRDGSFELQNVVPGPYTMIVRTQSGPRGGIGFREPLDVGNRDMADLMIRLTPPTRVTGRVEFPAGAGVDPARLRIALTDSQSFLGAGDTALRADGSFQLDGVPAGPYQISLPLPDGVYLQSVRAGEQEILGQDLVVTAAGTPPVRLILSSGTGSVSGAIVEEGKAVPDLKVLLLPTEKRLWRAERIKTITADPAGRFTFRSVAPGDYAVYAFRELEMGIWEDEDEFRRFESFGKKVSIKKDATGTLELLPVP